jgi:ubiquinone/menaquinone biosynthesis C-methylase UbiE
MASIRKPFTGVLNIIRFNRHYYLFALAFILLIAWVAPWFSEYVQQFLWIILGLVILASLSTLIVSTYIYDFSKLYQLAWVNDAPKAPVLVNIHAGFDETSILLKEKFGTAKLIVLDFYDPQKHTEISIKRARKCYPSFTNTLHISTNNISLPDNSADKIFVIFSAHEIRDELERIEFLKELKRIIKPGGYIYITEHLRDWKNFLAYNFGFFHFYPKSTWLRNINFANLTLINEIKITPFISTFIIEKHGHTS